MAGGSGITAPSTAGHRGSARGRGGSDGSGSGAGTGTGAGGHANGQAAGGPVLVPVALSIPDIGVEAPVLPEAVSVSGVLGVPGGANQVGWWNGGAAPGAVKGAAVLDGHVGGVFGQLSRLRPGDTVVVAGAGGRLDFVVTKVHDFPKDTLLYQSLFAQDGAGQLLLVTCGGPVSAAGHYGDSLVVFASRA